MIKSSTIKSIAFIGNSEVSASLVDRLHEAGFTVNGLSLSTSGKKTRKKDINKTISEADVIVTMLASPQEVEECYFSSDGILANIKPQSYCIDLSRNTPRNARELHALASVHDCFFVEAAPVASQDGMQLIVGGETPIVKHVRPILDALSPEILLVGLPGTAASAKIALTISKASALMGLVETLVFAYANHVDKKSIPAFMALDPSTTPEMKEMAQSIMEEQYDEGEPLAIFFHDLSLALDAADDIDLALPVLETAHQLYDLLMMIGGSKKAIQALMLVYRNEEYCVEQGLDWGLAQRAMDIYDQAAAFSQNDYECDCDDPDCGHEQYRGDDDYPRMDDFFSSN